VIAIENTRLMTETREALDQQTATAEVLQVINSSPGDLTPVFDAMLEKALRLCGAAFGMMIIYDGQSWHRVADRGIPAAYAEYRRQNAHVTYGPDTAPGRMIVGEDVVYNLDLMAEEAYGRGEPNRRALVDLGGARSHLAVALRKDGTLLGQFAIYRQEVRPFSDKQIALLQNFAAQAVIAMDNARLITETREALEQQTATAEVLQVINSSPGDLAPVFDSMVQKAITLCDAVSGTLWICDGERFDPVTVGGESRLAEWFLQHRLSRAAPDTPGGRLLGGERIVHIADVRQDPAYAAHPLYREMADIENCRTFIAVGLRKEDNLLGMITAYRQEVRPFTDKQIALLQNFAAQAVIAMENARLLTETREALEQQTATAEVLQVINSSPGNLTPVFDAMLERAMRLCETPFGYFLRYDGGTYSLAAAKGLSAEFLKYMAHMDQPVAGDANARVLEGEAYVHVVDLKDTDTYRSRSPLRRANVDLGGFRSALTVPLRKDDLYWAPSVSVARRSARSPTSRSRFCRTSLPKRSSQWKMRDFLMKSASVRPNCGSLSTTWLMVWPCSMQACIWRRGIAISRNCLIYPTIFSPSVMASTSTSDISSSAASSARPTPRP